MWFDSLIEDLKEAFSIAYEKRGIFIPILLKLGVQIILGLILVAGVIITILSGVFTGVSDAEPLDILLSVALPGTLLLGILYVLYLVFWACLEVGSLSLYQGAIQQLPLTKDMFFNGIRHYMVRVASGKLLLHFILLVLSPLLLVVYLLSFILIGTLTAGWGILFINNSIACLLATWTIAIVNDNQAITEGFKISFRMAKKHFKPLFMLLFSSAMVGQYAIHLLGPVGLLLAGWLVGGIVATYFKVTLYLTYLRYRDSVMDLYSS